MKEKWIRWIVIAIILSGVLLVAYAAYTINVTLLVIGIIFMVVSIILAFFLLTLQLFRRDKQLDLEALKNAGLTIVNCPKCDKNNVLEDQFCIHCGEKLGEQNE